MSSKPSCPLKFPVSWLMKSFSARSSMTPVRFSTNTELSLTLLVCSPEAIIPTMEMTKKNPMMMKKRNSPTTVANTDLKNPFIMI